MKTRTVATPVWVKALVVLVAVGLPAWWIADRYDRVTNQDRLAAIASTIAGRDVQVRCPGPLGRLLNDAEILEGSVQFDAQGRPSDTTKLRATTCAELDALAEGRRADQLACAERSISCGAEGTALAMAVDVVTHEAFHLRGIMDEAETECHSLQAMAATARRLGASDAQAAGLVRLHVATTLPQMPQRYRSADCALPA